MADDDDFNLDTNLEHPLQLMNMMTSMYKNRPYDEAILVGDEEEMESNSINNRPHRKPNDHPGLDPVLQEMLRDGRDICTKKMLMSGDEEDSKDEFSNETMDSNDEDDEEDSEHISKLMCAEVYDKLPVSAEVKDLFRYVNGFTPQEFNLDLYLRPFIPNYLPASGDVDIMIKVPRPDGKPDFLGMTILDEPIIRQTDPAIFKLAVRMERKQVAEKAREEIVKSISYDPKEIDHWITSLDALHRTQAPPKVQYTRNMPSIDTLMQEWGPEIEELLNRIDLPTAELVCELPLFVDIICSLLDIPVYKSRVESLHLVFSLYMEFKNSQHFGATERRGNIPAETDQADLHVL